MTPISVEQLKSMQDQNPDMVLVNTLSPDDFEVTKIPGAINIPESHESFVRLVERVAGGKGKAIIVYCANTECTSSPRAAEKLEKAGFEKVFDFAGGYRAWEQQEGNAPQHASASAE